MFNTRKSSVAAAFTILMAAGASFTQSATAGDTAISDSKKTVVAPVEEKSWCEKLWEYPTIYKNDDATFLNEFRFVGRAHFDGFMVDSDRGYEQDWIVRRLRIGFKARLFHNLTAHAEVDLNPQSQFVGHPTYQRLTDAYLAWKFSDAFVLTAGKQSVKFTLDGATSSNELLTIDRNNIANNLWFTTEYVPGVSLGGKARGWQYSVGVFSGGVADKEFGEFNAGTFGLVTLGYDFGKLLNVKKALLRADYVYNEEDLDSTFTRPFENVGALVFQLDAGRWGFSAELTGGTGFENQSDVWGATIMPWYNLTKQIQIVARYNYMESSDPRGIRLNRYDSFVSSQRGDEYHEIYGGLNYYICGHRLKVQTGVSYVQLTDSSIENGEYHGWQWTTGLRISF